MLKRTRQKLVAGACALSLVVGVGAAVGASKLGSPQEESTAVIAAAATDLGVTSAELTAALKKAMSARVDAAVAAGTMTAAEGTEAKARIAAGEVPLVGFRGGGGRGHHGGGLHFQTSAAAAAYLGLTEAELRTARDAGKSLATIAADEGKTVAGLVDAMVAAATKEINAAVTAGDLTDAQRDDILATLEERITDKVNRVGHEHGPRPSDA